MRLYDPITTVTKKTRADGKAEYFMHAVTFLDSNIFKADGHRISQNGNDLNVDLLISVDRDINHMGVISPVVHNVTLGELSGDGTKINTIVKYKERFVGRSTTQDDDAEEDDKPIPPFIGQ